eukprot:UN04622
MDQYKQRFAHYGWNIELSIDNPKEYIMIGKDQSHINLKQMQQVAELQPLRNPIACERFNARRKELGEAPIDIFNMENSKALRLEISNASKKTEQTSSQMLQDFQDWLNSMHMHN